MHSDLAALLIPPQEERFRARFDLRDAPLTLITSGWQKLIVQTPDRVFAFPRGVRQVPMVVREADVLSNVGPAIGPRLLGLHRDPAISPHPFLELSRIPGMPWHQVEHRISGEDAAQCLAQLARHIAVVHHLGVPDHLAARPDYLDNPRIVDEWTRPTELAATTRRAADQLSPYLDNPDPARWAQFLDPIARMRHTAVHGELSRGQFLVDDRLHISGIVDWDGLHTGHPLLDLDFGVDLYRIYEPLCDRARLRQRMWTAYASARGGRLPEWRSVRLFWCLLDALTVLHEDDRSRIPGEIADLRDATRYP